MYTQCLICGEQLFDNGFNEIIVCPKCGNGIKSRAFDPVFNDGTIKNFNEDFNTYDNKEDEKTNLDSYYIKKEFSSFNNFINFISLTAIICLLIIFFIEFFLLFPSIFIVTPEIINATLKPIFIALPYPPFIFTPEIKITGIYLVSYYFFLVISIILSFVWIIKNELKSAINILVKSINITSNPPKDSKNSFILIPQLFLAIIFFNIIYIIILLVLGITFSDPDFGDFWETLFLLTRASVYEEIALRLFFIGIPLLIVESIILKRKSLRKYIFGGGFELSNYAIFFVIFSSLLFGLAHIDSWDLYKVIPTFIGGLAFGYLFLIKGIHTAIILHFAIDFLGVPLSFAEEVNSDFGIIMATGLLIIVFGLVLIAGLNYFTYYSKSVIGFVINKLNKNSINSTLDIYPCPNCGNPVKFKNRIIECKTCGFSKDNSQEL